MRLGKRRKPQHFCPIRCGFLAIDVSDTQTLAVPFNVQRGGIFFRWRGMGHSAGAAVGSGRRGAGRGGAGNTQFPAKFEKFAKKYIERYRELYIR